MKTTKIFAATIAAFLMTTTMSANSFATFSEAPVFIAAASANNQKVIENSHHKTIFTTDNEGRVISKLILHRSSSEDTQWTPESAYSIYYGNGENILTFGAWNGKDFRAKAQQVHYDAKEFPVLINMPK